MKFSDLGEIALAWYRATNPTPEQQDLAIERLAICDTCEFKVPATGKGSYKCSACGCPLHKKIFSSRGPNMCPKGKWAQ